MKTRFYITLATFSIFLSVFPFNPIKGQLKVVSSASIFQDMTSIIGGEHINSLSIVPVGGDPHLYEPKPSDASLVESADVIFVNGLNFEGWINELIENSGSTAIVHTITEGVKPIASETYSNAFDPHAWMDVSNGLRYIENIKKALVLADPDHADNFQENYEKYRSELLALDAYIESSIAKIPSSQRVLITTHDAFAYYGNRYGIEVEPVMGISTDAEVQTSDIIRVEKVLSSRNIPAVFIESTINPKLLQRIAKDHNVAIGGELFADSIGKKGSDGDSYVKMLKHNTDVIVDALSKNINRSTKLDKDESSNHVVLYIALGLGMLLAMFSVILKLR